MIPRLKRGERGFGLFELLVALALVAATGAVAYRIMGSSTRGADSATRYTRAVLLAESRMAELGVLEVLQPGETIGDAGDGYLWRVSVRLHAGYPMRDLAPGPQGPPGLPPPVVPLEVAVTVAWGAEERPSEVTLTTLRLVPRKP